MTAADMPRNGLDYHTLRSDVGHDWLEKMRNNSLQDVPWNSILVDDDLARLSEYVVSCALAPHTMVDGVKINGRPLEGQMGLCNEWLKLPPDNDCLERVSSCLLARMNGLGRRVVISVRGTKLDPLPLRDKVSIETKYREDPEGISIESFNSCGSGMPSEDCGWTKGYVGSCTPGQMVRLIHPMDVAVRVCRGIYGCDHKDWMPGETGSPTQYNIMGIPMGTPWYSGKINITEVDNTVTFTCLGNGITDPMDPVHPASASAPAPSYFGVMLIGLNPMVNARAAADNIKISGGKYPLTEEEVFTYREGAFFGNVFDDIPALSFPQPDTGGKNKFLVGNQYACYSEIWNSGEAHLTDRICALPDLELKLGNTCLVNSPEPCLWSPTLPTLVDCDHVCQSEVCKEGGYLGCQSSSVPGSLSGIKEWTHALTVYLNNPCDLSLDRETCATSFKNFNFKP
jgi:hypothetical protein